MDYNREGQNPIQCCNHVISQVGDKRGYNRVNIDVVGIQAVWKGSGELEHKKEI